MPHRLPLLFAVLLCLPLGSCGPSVPLTEEARATPYLGYFETLRPGGIYLFATLDAKQQFERGSSDLRFREYVDRTGVLVYIHAPTPTGDAPPQEPTEREVRLREEGKGSMIERIARGFEITRDTELTLRTDPDAPPIEARLPEFYAGDPATREARDNGPANGADGAAPGEGPGTAPAQPGETAVGRQEQPESSEQPSDPGPEEAGPGGDSPGGPGGGDSPGGGRPSEREGSQSQQVGPGSGGTTGGGAQPSGGGAEPSGD